MKCSSVEERRASMNEVSLVHELVGLNRALDVVAVNADGNTHEYVLRTLCDVAVETKEV